MNKELKKQFTKTKRLLRPSGNVQTCLIELHNLMLMFYEYLESKSDEKAK